MTLQPGTTWVACEDRECNGRGTMVPALLDPAVPGLALTRMHVHGAMSELAERAWVVTHRQSGQTLGDAFFADQAAAEHALRRFGQLGVNWREPPDVILARDRTLVPILVDIIEEGQAMRSGLLEQ